MMSDGLYLGERARDSVDVRIGILGDVHQLDDENGRRYARETLDVHRNFGVRRLDEPNDLLDEFVGCLFELPAHARLHRWYLAGSDSINAGIRGG